MEIRSILFGLILFGSSSSVIAIPILHTINFSGGVTTNAGNMLTATVFTFANPISVASSSGSLLPLSGEIVTYNDPLNINSLVVLLWSRFLASNSYSDSFNLNPITNSTSAPGISRLSTGAGRLNITGTVSPFTTTAATRQLSSQAEDTPTFSFSSADTTTPVPEPLPLALVALGLLVIGIFGHKRRRR